MIATSMIPQFRTATEEVSNRSASMRPRWTSYSNSAIFPDEAPAPPETPVTRAGAISGSSVPDDEIGGIVPLKRKN